jgi:hypothetical protein
VRGTADPDGPDVSDVPDEVLRLLEEREAARRAKDYAVADALRDRIVERGFAVTDSRSGTLVTPAASDAGSIRALAPSEVVEVLDQPSRFDASVHWIVEGWPDDIRRGIAAFERHHPGAALQHVVVDQTGTTRDAWPDGVDLVPLRNGFGWARARNAGLIRSLGSIVLVVDGSVEVTGPVLPLLRAALEEPSVGVTGPFGIVTDDLHEFRDAPGPDVDAIEGYLMAFRRELLRGGLRFDGRFRFYRTADVDLSFRIKAMGLRATVTPVPVTLHQHRMWERTPPDRRDALSKRNHYRFLDTWRGRLDLTVAHGSVPTGRAAPTRTSATSAPSTDAATPAVPEER